MCILMMTISVKDQRWLRPRKGYNNLYMDFNYKIKNKRLSKYLYSLGFDRKCLIDSENKEYWMYKETKVFHEALDFYFHMRKKNRE